MDTERVGELMFLMDESKSELLAETGNYINRIKKDYSKTLTEVIALRNELESGFREEPEVVE